MNNESSHDPVRVFLTTIESMTPSQRADIIGKTPLGEPITRLDLLHVSAHLIDVYSGLILAITDLPDLNKDVLARLGKATEALRSLSNTVEAITQIQALAESLRGEEQPRG